MDDATKLETIIAEVWDRCTALVHMLVNKTIGRFNPQYSMTVEVTGWNCGWLITGLATGAVTGMGMYSFLRETYGLTASVYCQKRVQFWVVRCLWALSISCLEGRPCCNAMWCSSTSARIRSGSECISICADCFIVITCTPFASVIAWHVIAWHCVCMQVLLAPEPYRSAASVTMFYHEAQCNT